MLSALLSNARPCLGTFVPKGDLLPPRCPGLVPCPGLWGSSSQRKVLGPHMFVQPCLFLQRERMPLGAPAASGSDPWLLGVRDGPNKVESTGVSNSRRVSSHPLRTEMRAFCSSPAGGGRGEAPGKCGSQAPSVSQGQNSTRPTSCPPRSRKGPSSRLWWSEPLGAGVRQ